MSLCPYHCDRQPVMTTSLAEVPLVGDRERLSFWAEIALDKLAPGRYVLQVTATDHAGSRTAAGRVNFIVE